jgi:hypothetical protein
MKGDDKQISSICVEDDVDYNAVVSVIDEGVVIMQDGKIISANPAFSVM